MKKYSYHKIKSQITNWVKEYTNTTYTSYKMLVSLIYCPPENWDQNCNKSIKIIPYKKSSSHQIYENILNFSHNNNAKQNNTKNSFSPIGLENI